MKLIKPSYQILDQPPGLDGIYQQIEMAGRTCYRSQRPEGRTAKDFVDRMIASQHYAMLEHGTVYLTIPFNRDVKNWGKLCNKYSRNPYSKVHYNNYVYGLTEAMCYITTNLRVLVENDWLDDLQYLCESTEYHEKRVTVRFTTDRGVSHEFVRHRVFSFAQESTRYCNYSKDKFDNEITYILPPWIKETDVRNFYENSKGDNFLKYNEDSLGGSFIFLFNLEELEEAYIALVKEEGWKPQEARAILPNALKTELVMTGFVSDWNHFFDLRARGTTGAPHPDAKALAEPLMKEFQNRELL